MVLVLKLIYAGVFLFIGHTSTHLNEKSHVAEEKSLLYNDTLIHDARLIDSISEDIIWRLPDHMALLMRFQIANSMRSSDTINLLVFAPEWYGKNFFKLNRHYSIYGNTNIARIPFRPVKDFSDNYFMIRCDSIKPKN
jgi:hypothetical protein